MTDDIISKKEYYCHLTEGEILKATSSYNENIDRIHSLNLFDSPDFQPMDIKKGLLYIHTSAKIVNNEIKPVALMFFSPESCISKYVDVSLIHEINHAIELSLIQYDAIRKDFLYQSGFERFRSADEDEIRNYEKFSEIINHMIAMEITEAMHRDGVYLIDHPEKSKIQGGSSYEHQRIMIGPFWERFKKETMYARVHGDMESLFQVVGEENFNHLNDLVNQYAGMPFYTLLDDFINNRATELTEKRTKLINDAYHTTEKAMVEHATQNSDYESVTGKTM